MAKVKIELNSPAIRDLLRGPEITDYLGKVAGDIAGKAGDGYGSKTVVMPSRSIGIVSAQTGAARRDNLKNNTLLKAVGR